MRLTTTLAITLLACDPEKPPAPEREPAGEEPARSASLDPKTQPFVLTFAGERGAFADTSKIDNVPEAARGLVRVALLDGPDPPPGTVWVANLRTPAEDGTYALSTVPRTDFEELALGQGLASKVTLPEGLEPPPQSAAPAGRVIVYKTAWCGVCKKVEEYLERKGVDFVAKDIEADRAAASELQAKAKTKGIAMGSVPVIDVGGELIVGFDRGRLEKLLGS
jgi:glutaredoxin